MSVEKEFVVVAYLCRMGYSYLSLSNNVALPILVQIWLCRIAADRRPVSFQYQLLNDFCCMSKNIRSSWIVPLDTNSWLLFAPASKTANTANA